MNSKKNKNKLATKLDQLPKHTPPPSTWERLEQELLLEEQLAKLPTYTPPNSVWKNMEQDLPTPSVWKKYIAIAAAILFIVSASIFWYTATSTPSYELAYSQETITINMLEVELDTSEQTEEQIRIYCQVKLLACSSPEFRRLERALQELEDAKMELQAAIALVGENPDLMAQMNDIEIERSTVLQEMIVQVL